MSTRKLIIASLICGLLILLAGSVKLLQTTNGSNASNETVRLFTLGTTTQVGTLAVSVDKVEVTSEQTLVDVTVAGLGDEFPLSAWTMLANGEITEPLSTSSCPNGEGEVRCTLEFVVAVGTPTIVFVFDGVKTQWLGA